MNNTLIGKKLGMTQVFDKENRLVPVTAVEVGPCPVVQVKTVESDGYNAIQIGFGERKASRLTKQMEGHFKKHGVAPAHYMTEVRSEEAPSAKSGDVLTAEIFVEGGYVDVIGTTKGRGFQGVMKRHNFHGGPASHGSMFHRRGGSFGMCQWPGRIFKGRKMPGHMGVKQRTQQNLEVVKVIPEKNLVLIKGSIPGNNDSIIYVREAKKKGAVK